MRKKVFSLDDPQVQAAKLRFEKNNSYRKGSLGFEELFVLFGNDCYSMTDIAKLDGTTRQAVNILYNKYFVGLYRRTDGRHRQKICTLKRRVTAKSSEPTDKILHKIWSKAKGYGLKVRRKPFRNYELEFATRTINIENKSCRVHHLTKPDAKGFGRILTCSSAIKRNDFLLIVRAIPGFPETIFVVPAEVMLEALKGRSACMVYIPCRRPDRLPKPKIDFWEYEDAWHLLGAKPVEANSS